MHQHVFVLIAACVCVVRRSFDVCELLFGTASIVGTFTLSLFNLRNLIKIFFGGRLMVAIEMAKVGDPRWLVLRSRCDWLVTRPTNTFTRRSLRVTFRREETIPSFTTS